MVGTADLVTRPGGRGIPVAVDHLDPAQVATLDVDGSQPDVWRSIEAAEG